MDEQDARVVRHLKRFEDESGGLTPDEYHWKHTYRNKRCSGCGAKLGPGSLRATSFMPLDEFTKRNPELAYQMAKAAAERGKTLESLIVTASDGIRYLKASTAYACAAHAKDLEHTAAKSPSWVYVDFDRGVGTRPTVVGPTFPTAPSFDILAP